VCLSNLQKETVSERCSLVIGLWLICQLHNNSIIINFYSSKVSGVVIAVEIFNTSSVAIAVEIFNTSSVVTVTRI